MSEEEAQAMLKQLAEHYGSPVLPLENFCAAMRIWSRCIEERNEEADGYPQGADYWKVLDQIDIDISKSNLLGRLLYAGEKLRMTRCPVHNGRWDGGAMLMGCEHNCDGTGWLREEGDAGGYTGGIMLVRAIGRKI